MSFIDQIKEVATVTPDGTDTVRGVPTTRYNVTIDPAKSPLGVGEPGSVKLWTDAKNRLARFQVGISGDRSLRVYHQRPSLLDRLCGGNERVLGLRGIALHRDLPRGGDDATDYRNLEY